MPTLFRYLIIDASDAGEECYPHGRNILSTGNIRLAGLVCGSSETWGLSERQPSHWLSGE